MISLMNTVFGSASRRTSRGGLVQRIDAAMGLYRSRARLASLDAHLLADIGLNAQEAKAEADRPIWDAPAAWKR